MELDRLKLVHSSQVVLLQLQLSDLNTQSQLAKAENEADIAELKSKAGALESQVERQLHEREQSASQLRRERQKLEEAQRQHEVQLRKERQEFETQLTNERETNRKLTANVHDLQAGISKLESEIALKDTIFTMNEATAKRKDTGLDAKSRAIEEKDATISAMSEQLTKTREYLATNKQQVSTSSAPPLIIISVCRCIIIVYDIIYIYRQLNCKFTGNTSNYIIF